MLNAMLGLARSGSAWEDLPERYPPHQSVYSRFCKWRDTGVLESVFCALNADADLENLSIDSTSVKAHPQSAGAKKAVNAEFNQFIGVSRGGKNTKIHAIVDALRNPISFLLSGGQVHDSKMAIALLETTNIQGSNILADRACGTAEIRSYIAAHDAEYMVPPKQNAKEPWHVDWWLYKECHLVQCH